MNRGTPEDMEHREWGPRGESRVEGALEIPNLGPQEGRFNQGGVGAELGLVWFGVHPSPPHILQKPGHRPQVSSSASKTSREAAKNGQLCLKKSHDSACIPHA